MATVRLVAVANPTLALSAARLALTRDRGLAMLFTGTVFVAALLLFLVQPMVAKGLLPLFGGTSAVWTTAMLFFQAALLAGYALAHASLRWLGPHRQSRVQLLVLGAGVVALPLAAPVAPIDADPLISLLILLTAGVGLPFVALSTASPVFQRWFSVSGHPRANNPYVLYVASNVGSLLALLAYPFVIEPNLSLDAQRIAWSALYLAFIVLALTCAVVLFPPGAGRAALPAMQERSAVSEGSPVQDAAKDRASLTERVRWLLLAFVPSSLMLGVTAYLTTDIASAPLLWILPLALYLTTFIIAFSHVGPPATRIAGRVLPFLAVAVAVDMLDPLGLPVVLRLGTHLALFTAAAILCHGRLAAGRPRPHRLTEFYLFLALGGVGGGIVNGILAPEFLNYVIEYPIVIGLALALGLPIRGGPARRWGIGLVAWLAFVAVAIGIGLVFPGAVSVHLVIVLASLPLLVIALPVPFGLIVGALLSVSIVLGPPALLTERNFFGLITVVENPGEHVLVHGTTVHGRQAWPPDVQPSPNGYYHPDGPLGDVMSGLGPTSEIGILGLGSGGIAAYGLQGQQMVFYEIDPQMADVAADQRLFTYLSSSQAEIHVRIGDGRILLADEPAGRFDLLIMDAFTSDSVPVHLLTREAFQLYVDRLNDSGLLVVHISNRYVDLRSVVSAAARDLGLSAWSRLDPGVPSQDVRTLHGPSHWVVMARDSEGLKGLPGTWSPLPATQRAAWTDDFSDILSVLDWRGDILR